MVLCIIFLTFCVCILFTCLIYVLDSRNKVLKDVYHFKDCEYIPKKFFTSNFYKLRKQYLDLVRDYDYLKKEYSSLEKSYKSLIKSIQSNSKTDFE